VAGGSGGRLQPRVRLAGRLAWLAFPNAWPCFLLLLCGLLTCPCSLPAAAHPCFSCPIPHSLPACLPACPACSKFAINFDGGAKARLYLQSEQWEPLDLELLQVLPPCTALYRQRCIVSSALCCAASLRAGALCLEL
jgi:hypothetical protein